MSTSGSSTVVYTFIPPPPPSDRLPVNKPFKLGDFVTVLDTNGKEHPGVIIQVEPRQLHPYRVSGFYKDFNAVWSDWYQNHEIAHDIAE